MVKQSLEEAGLAQEWEINMHVPAATSCSGWKTLEEWMCCGNTPSSVVSSKTCQLLFLRTLIFHKPLLLLRNFAAEAQPLKSLYCSTTKVPSTQTTTFLRSAPRTPFSLLQAASAPPKPLPHMLVLSLIKSNLFWH